MTESFAAEIFALGVGALLVGFAPRWAAGLERLLARVSAPFAGAPRWTPWLLGASTALVAMLAAVYVHWPLPSVHDEFAYLLGAETFAGGELTRPTHPLWRHFETFHVLQEPSYAPKYPTGQSLALASGMVLTGELRAGLWLQAGAMVAAISWMFFQWLPGRWAILGALFVAMQLGVRGPWVQTFYGGALAATGGALLLGSVPGILNKVSVWSAMLMGVGLVLLACSRPFEGLVASVPVAIVLLRAWLGGRSTLGPSFTVRIVLPLLCVLGVGGVWLAVHNRAVTGDPAVLPYVAYDEQYSVYPPFLWQETRPAPEYRLEAIEWFMLHFQRGDHGVVDGPVDALGLSVSRQTLLINGLLGLPLSLFLLLSLASQVLLHPRPVKHSSLPALRPRPRQRGGPAFLPVAIAVAVGIASSVTTYAAPHYAAPGLGALMIVTVTALRRARIASRRLRGSAVPLVLAALVAVAITTVERGSKTWLGGARVGGHIRSLVIERLEAEPGPDLVLVRTRSMESLHQEFVYNAADIDRAPIVWARDLASDEAPDANVALFEYFAGRTVWALSLGSAIDGEWELELLSRAEASSYPDVSTLPWGSW